MPSPEELARQIGSPSQPPQPGSPEALASGGPQASPTFFDRVQGATAPLAEQYDRRFGEPLRRELAHTSAQWNPYNWATQTRATFRGEAEPNVVDKFLAELGPVDTERAAGYVGAGAGALALRYIPRLAAVTAAGGRVLPALIRALGIGAGTGIGAAASGQPPLESLERGAMAGGGAGAMEVGGAIGSKLARSGHGAKQFIAEERMRDIAAGMREHAPGLEAVGPIEKAVDIKKYGGPEGKAALGQAKEQAIQAAELDMSETIHRQTGMTLVPSEIPLWTEAPAPGVPLKPRIGGWGGPGRREVTLREANEQLSQLYEDAYGVRSWERGIDTRQAQLDYRDLSARIETAMGHGGIYNVPTPKAAGIFRQAQNEYKAGRGFGDLTNESALYRQFPSGEQIQPDQLAIIMQRPAVRDELINRLGGLDPGSTTTGPGVRKYQDFLRTVLRGQASGAGAVVQGAGRSLDAPMDLTRGSRGSGLLATFGLRFAAPNIGAQYPGVQPRQVPNAAQIILDLLGAGTERQLMQ